MKTMLFVTMIVTTMILVGEARAASVTLSTECGDSVMLDPETMSERKLQLYVGLFRELLASCEASKNRGERNRSYDTRERVAEQRIAFERETMNRRYELAERQLVQKERDAELRRELAKVQAGVSVVKTIAGVYQCT